MKHLAGVTLHQRKNYCISYFPHIVTLTTFAIYARTKISNLTRTDPNFCMIFNSIEWHAITDRTYIHFPVLQRSVLYARERSTSPSSLDISCIPALQHKKSITFVRHMYVAISQTIGRVSK